jgi:hypothetical protein
MRWDQQSVSGDYSISPGLSRLQSQRIGDICRSRPDWSYLRRGKTCRGHRSTELQCASTFGRPLDQGEDRAAGAAGMAHDASGSRGMKMPVLTGPTDGVDAGA